MDLRESESLEVFVSQNNERDIHVDFNVIDGLKMDVCLIGWFIHRNEICSKNGELLIMKKKTYNPPPIPPRLSVAGRLATLQPFHQSFFDLEARLSRLEKAHEVAEGHARVAKKALDSLEGRCETNRETLSKNAQLVGARCR